MSLAPVSAARTSAADAASLQMQKPTPIAVVTPVPLDAARLSRIRWRCRRGMLENDLVLTRYLDAKGATLTEEEIAALDRLLELSDNALWDLIAGKEEPGDPVLLPMVRALRNA